MLTKRPENRKVLKCRWVFVKEKNNDGTIRQKARLVAKCFSQKQCIDYNETFVPTMSLKSLRVLIGIAAMKRLVVRQIDIKTAFLNGKLEELVYMEQPEGSVDSRFPCHFCKLHKSIYGLK